MGRPQTPRGLRCGSTTTRLLGLRVRIPPVEWKSVCCECCVLSSRGLCDGLITRPEESYRMCCFAVCDLEASRMRRLWPALGRSATGKKPIQWQKTLSRIVIFGRRLIKVILGKVEVSVWVRKKWLKQARMPSFCECGNEIYGSIELISSSLFRDVTQRKLVFIYRCIGRGDR